MSGRSKCAVVVLATVLGIFIAPTCYSLMCVSEIRGGGGIATRRNEIKCSVLLGLDPEVQHGRKQLGRKPRIWSRIKAGFDRIGRSDNQKHARIITKLSSTGDTDFSPLRRMRYL